MPKYLIYTIVLLTLLTGAAITFLAYNTYRNSSLPPGCQKHIIPTFGGCFANFSIQDIKLNPEISCLDVIGENCNTPSIYVKNNCGEDIIVNDITIPSENKRCSTNWQDFYIATDPQHNTIIQTEKTCIDVQQDVKVDGIIDSKPVQIIISSKKNSFKNIHEYIPPAFSSCLRVSGFGGEDCQYVKIEYSCDVPLEIGNRTINPKEETCVIEPGKEIVASHEIAPIEDSRQSISGFWKEQLFTIGYTVTKKQCN